MTRNPKSCYWGLYGGGLYGGGVVIECVSQSAPALLLQVSESVTPTVRERSPSIRRALLRADSSPRAPPALSPAAAERMNGWRDPRSRPPPTRLNLGGASRVSGAGGEKCASSAPGSSLEKLWRPPLWRG